MAVDLSMPVLVVDDYSTMIRIIRNLLKQLGFDNIDDASDGSAALNKMRGKKYGLVISDWNMEPMTGYDLLKEIRGDPNLAEIPFIMVTAESKTDNVIAAKTAATLNRPLPSPAPVSGHCTNRCDSRKPYASLEYVDSIATGQHLHQHRTAILLRPLRLYSLGSAQGCNMCKQHLRISLLLGSVHHSV